ncbi:PURPLE ACID PHOSPHATASE-RELATED [Salix koriyanagi]|uniref:Purple acid phosphatase n=1 Tax=Salix koriyanagi TaxID=2511006 RepID=A0A9Q1AAT7_9ROSI|nr:PURPLE ACID PHOSPHATASE-RELATED [Salix koriyanagi]
MEETANHFPVKVPATSLTVLVFWLLCSANLTFVQADIHGAGEQALAKIDIYKTTLALDGSAVITAYPRTLGSLGEDSEWITVNIVNEKPSADDWVGVFSPANFNASTCPPQDEQWQETPYICTAPIKYKYANHSNPEYTETGKTTLRFLLINQRADFAFVLFSGGLSNHHYTPRLAHGKSWDEMTVTWTSGYNIDEAVPFVEWGMKGETPKRSPAGTLTFKQNSMCGSPARTVGWRDPGFIHTSFLKDLWPNTVYTYRMGHILSDGSCVQSKVFSFKSSPYPGQDSLQRVIIFGDMGKAERDGSNEYSDYQPGSLNTTDQLIKDLDNIDVVFHIGDLPYANGYISQWDQFTAQVQPITSTVPYMIASGNHERDWPNSGSFYDTPDSGGECGVPAETMYYVPAENRAKFWYSTDYGIQKQPWLIFSAHRVLGYSSNSWYGLEGSFEEPMGRESLQKLWQKYRVDIAFFGHVHNYERTCPIYQNQCVSKEKHHYSGTVNGTIHVVVAFDHSSLLFEYKKSSDGKVYDSFTISRDYRDVLACVHDSCPATTLAT